jgi:hypothetical protein
VGIYDDQASERKIVALGESFKLGIIEEFDYSKRTSILEDALERYADTQDRRAIPDPLNIDGVRLAFVAYSKGSHSDSEIAEILNQAGYRIVGKRGNTLLTKEAIQDILQNRFYIGETSYGRKIKVRRREWMPGNHEPLIERDLFELCQQVRERRGRAYRRGIRQPNMTYPLSGVLRCAHCGCSWKVGNRRGVRTYHDTSSQKKQKCPQTVKSLPATELELHAIDVFKGLVLPDDWRDQVLEE